MVLKEPEPGFYLKNLVFTFGSQCEPSKIQKVSIYEGRVTLLWECIFMKLVTEKKIED